MIKAVICKSDWMAKKDPLFNKTSVSIDCYCLANARRSSRWRKWSSFRIPSKNMCQFRWNTWNTCLWKKCLCMRCQWKCQWKCPKWNTLTWIWDFTASLAKDTSPEPGLTEETTMARWPGIDGNRRLFGERALLLHYLFDLINDTNTK